MEWGGGGSPPPPPPVCSIHLDDSSMLIHYALPSLLNAVKIIYILNLTFITLWSVCLLHLVEYGVDPGAVVYYRAGIFHSWISVNGAVNVSPLCTYFTANLFTPSYGKQFYSTTGILRFPPSETAFMTTVGPFNCMALFPAYLISYTL